MADPEELELAKSMIKSYGRGAPAMAEQYAKRSWRFGDKESHERWQRILAIINGLSGSSAREH